MHYSSSCRRLTVWNTLSVVNGMTIKCFPVHICESFSFALIAGSDHVLGSTPLTLYGLENKMTVWPIKMNGTTPKWRISPKKSTSFVRVIYSRLVIRSLSQTAGSHITYELWNGKKLIHSSAKARIEVGRKFSIIGLI